MNFRPPWWSWLVLVLALAVLGGLGTWQLQRAQVKAQMLDQRAAASKAAPVPLAAAPAPGRLSRRHVVASGHYLAQRQLLLDNQVWQGRAGYRVWTPLRLDDGRLVLVDRGWVPLGRDRAHPPSPPAPAGAVRVTGYLRDLPKPGLRLRAPGVCTQTGWPRALNYPTAEQVACQYTAPVVAGLLLLGEAAPGGFARDWSDVGMPPRRHIGYAVQWYAMAVAVVVIFIVVNWKRRQTSHGRKR